MQAALDGIQPALVPIFPWHFADFVERDPPLIDVSMDLEEMEREQQVLHLFLYFFDN